MSNQQTTTKEYQLQGDIAKSLARMCHKARISDLEEWTTSELINDDHGYPISGDHLPRSK